MCVPCCVLFICKTVQLTLKVRITWGTIDVVSEYAVLPNRVALQVLNMNIIHLVTVRLAPAHPKVRCGPSGLAPLFRHCVRAMPSRTAYWLRRLPSTRVTRLRRYYAAFRLPHRRLSFCFFSSVDILIPREIRAMGISLVAAMTGCQARSGLRPRVPGQPRTTAADDFSVRVTPSAPISRVGLTRSLLRQFYLFGCSR